MESDSESEMLEDIKQIINYKSNRTLFIEEIQKFNEKNKFVIHSEIESKFYSIYKWPNFILNIIFGKNLNNVNRLCLALFFKFNNSNFEFLIKIIGELNPNLLNKERREELLYLWHKTLNIEKNIKIIDKYYYYNLEKKKLVYLNGKDKEGKWNLFICILFIFR